MGKGGFIYYSEFVQASLNMKEQFTESDLKYGFSYFDTDRDGLITASDLKEVNLRKGKTAHTKDLQRTITESNNGKHKITYEDF